MSRIGWCQWSIIWAYFFSAAYGFHVQGLLPRIAYTSSFSLSMLESQFKTFHSFHSSQSSVYDRRPTLLASGKDIADVEQRTIRQDFVRSLAWMGAATGFAAVIGAFKGPSAAIEFSSGYILELCLSVDNLFVFLVLFDYFQVSGKAQEKVLNYGIIGAMLLRGLFIGMGSVAIQQFHQVLLLFSAILGFSSLKILLSKDDEEEEEDFSQNPLIKYAQKVFRTSPDFDGDKFFTIQDGVKLATPLFICVICVELSDILFAFDSVPAIFGVTQDPVVVYTSNIFAIAGLRSLYTILSKAVSELKYLEKAVGVVLGVIAVKLGFETFDQELLSPLQSLVVVLGILGIGIGASLWDSDKQDSNV